jgi:hypothetical protein
MDSRTNVDYFPIHINLSVFIIYSAHKVCTCFLMDSRKNIDYFPTNINLSVFIIYSAHKEFTCFLMDSRTNIDYFPTNINLSVFITKAQSVYCAVRTGSIKATDPGCL